MSYDEQPDDPHGECRHEINRLQATTEILANQTRAEAERDRWKEQAKVNGKAGAMACSARISAEARADQAERDREQIREAWSDVTASHNRIKATADAISGDDYWGWLGDGDDDLETMSDGMQVRITAGCLRGVIEEAKAAPSDDDQKPILGALRDLSDDDFRCSTISDKLAGVEKRAAYREERLRGALKMGDDLVAKGAEKYREKCARLAEVEAERDQARLDAGIWERRVAEAAETIEALEFSAEKEAEVAKRYISELEAKLSDAVRSRDGWRAQADGLAASSKALEKAMHAQLERVAR